MSAIHEQPDFQSASNTQMNPYAPPKTQVEIPSQKRRGKLLPHEKAGRVIRLMALLGGVGAIGVVVAILLPILSTGKGGLTTHQVMTFCLLLALVVGIFIVGSAVMRHKTWARYCGIAYGIVSLFGFPIGTLVGIYVLWQLMFRWSVGEAAEVA